MISMELIPIGRIQTPYADIAPFRPDPEDTGEFIIHIEKKYMKAMKGLDEISYIIVYFYFSKSTRTNLLVHPPHLHGKDTGLFASRSPNRINKIGMDIVKVLRVEENLIYTSPMDILDGTPLLDIKPYISEIDNPFEK